MKSRNILIAILTVSTVLAGCSDDFLNRPPKDTLVDANFFKTDEQVLAGTAPLYSAVWKDYVDKANFKLGDERGGTVFRAWGDADAVRFNMTDVSEPNEQAYRSFFIIVGQSNIAIQNIERYAGAGVSDAIKKHAIAEARFMRATAYTHLVMNYEEIPIIENNLDHLTDPYLRKNTKESIWEFIKRDYEYAAENLLAEPVKPGRVTKWAAEGMLARTHLTMAGLGAGPNSRDQEHLDKAKEYAERVITMSGKSLAIDYATLFLYPYDNNNESLFELQWVFSTAPNSYEASNTMVSQITYSNDIAANGDGWGGDLSASWWLLTKYEGLVSKAVPFKVPTGQDSIPEGGLPGFTLDQRLKASFMLPGFTYPELISKATGAPLVFPNPGTADNNFASIKKYVVGKIDGESDRQRYPNNTYMLRLAEIYLIYAEAALGNSPSTTDPKALEYFNKVYKRAQFSPGKKDEDLTPYTDPLTRDVIFDERFKEFAMESMAWYDIVRLSYYDKQSAYNLINAQDRGLFVAKPNQWPNPTAWTFTKTSWFTARYVIAGDGNFRLPIPASEMSQAPSLSEPAVDYDFND